MRPCFPLSAVGSGRKTLDRQVWRPRRGSQPRTREASGHRPSLLRGTALQWAGRGRASGRNPALGAPKKPGRVAEATVPKPKVATTERRKASALRQGRGSECAFRRSVPLAQAGDVSGDIRQKNSAARGSQFLVSEIKTRPSMRRTA